MTKHLRDDSFKVNVVLLAHLLILMFFLWRKINYKIEGYFEMFYWPVSICSWNTTSVDETMN